MKLLLTIWISVVFAQEVFSSTLVRYPRNAVSKPTSSVHTEYEATYEQKGRQGNGSYSTVSGKQEVVHDNCHDNWNAFADKCATLIKDLVASLGNAVSSKPGDATNLQLRIRNTFKHFDSTDNCSCLINTKNSLGSLFDNITVSAVQPTTSNGTQVVRLQNIPSAQAANGNNAQGQTSTCEGESCKDNSISAQKIITASPKAVQQSGNRPQLLTNSENINPELADMSQESSSTNNRREVQYPEVITKDPAKSSGSARVPVANTKQSSSTSLPATNAKQILFPVPVTPQPVPAPAEASGTPTEVLVPLSQSQTSSKTRPLNSAVPSQGSAITTADRPAENTAKSGTLVKPVAVLGPVSRISPPAGSQKGTKTVPNNAGSGSGSSQVQDASKPVVVAPVKPVRNIVPISSGGSSAGNGGGSSETQNVASVPVPVSGAKVEPVSGGAVVPQITSEGEKDEDCDEEKDSESEQLSVAAPLSSSGDSNGSPIVSSTGSSQSVVSVPEAVNGAVVEPQSASITNKGSSAGTSAGSSPSVVSVPESVNGVVAQPQATSSTSKGSPAGSSGGSSQTPSVVSVPVPVSVNKVQPVSGVVAESQSEGNKAEDCDEEKDSESEQLSVAAPLSSSGDNNGSPIVNSTGSSPSVVSVSESVNGAVAQPQAASSTSKGSSAGTSAGSSQASSVISVPVPVSGTKIEPLSGVVAEPQSEGNKAEDCDEEKDSKSEQLSVAAPLSSSGDSNGSPIVSSTGSSQSVVSVPESVSGVVAQPQATSSTSKGSPAGSSGGSSQTPSVVSVPVPVSVNKVQPESGVVAESQSEGNKAEDCDEEKSPQLEQAAVDPLVISVSEPVNGAAAVPQSASSTSDGSPTENNAGPSQAPSVVPIVEPQSASSKDKGKGSESEQTAVVPPVISVPESVSGALAEPQTASGTGNGSPTGSNAESNQASSAVSLEPINGAVAESQTASSTSVGSPIVNSAGSNQAPSVLPVPEPVNGALAEPQITLSNSEGDKAEDCDEEKGSESEGASVVPPVIPIPESVGGASAEPQITSSKSEGNKDDDDDDDSDESDESDESDRTPSASSKDSSSSTIDKSVSISVKSEGDKAEDCDEEEGSGPNQTSVVPGAMSNAEPVVDAVAGPQISSSNVEGDKDDEGAAGNGSQSGQTTVVKPLTSSFQDPSTVVSDGSANLSSNPKSSVVPAPPVSNSGDSKLPAITQAGGSSQAPSSILDDSALPEVASTSDTVNVIPGLVKQPQSEHAAQNNPSAANPLINSNSNLPDSTAPVRTVNPTPVYEPLPTVPSPSSGSAVATNGPQSTSAVKAVPVAVDQTSQNPAEAATEGKSGQQAQEKVFIVTPIPAYPEQNDPIAQSLKPVATPTGSDQMGQSNPSKASEPQRPSNTITVGDEKIRPQVAPALVTAAPIYTAPVEPSSGISPPESQFLQPGGVQVASPQAGNDQQEIQLTTPTPLMPLVVKAPKGQPNEPSKQPSLQQHPLFSNLGNKKSEANQPTGTDRQSTAPNSVPPTVVVGEVPQQPSLTPEVIKPAETAEDGDLIKPTTFQTTSTDPTPPQQSIQSPPSLNTRPLSAPQPTGHGTRPTSPQTPHDDDDDDDEEDCCSCESCTEEETVDPKQYKEMACKDLEEARKELKAIFDKIKKRLKCGKKAPQKIVAS